MKKATAVACAMGLFGCASTELNYNTLDIASASDTLLTRQTLFNLANFLDSEVALPAQIVISTGTETTADTANLSATSPLTNAVTRTAQAVNTISSSPSLAVTNLTTGVTAGAGISGGAQAVRTQNYSFQLITDPNEMWRLKALYRFIVDGNEKKFVESYPLLYKTISLQRNACLTDASNHNAIVYGTAVTQDPKTGIPGKPFTSCVTSVSGTGTPTMTVGQNTYSVLVPDEHYLTGPTCIVCERWIAGKRKRVANENLKGGWLHWRSLPGANRPDNFTGSDIPIGQSGHYQFFVPAAQAEKFADFSIFVLSASTQTDSTISGGAGGGNAAGAGGAAASKLPAANPAAILIGSPTL